MDVRPSYRYRVYGLTIDANRPIPDLPEAVADRSEAPVVVDFVGRSPPDVVAPPQCRARFCVVENQDIHLRYEYDVDWMEFRIGECGDQVQVDWSAGVHVDAVVPMLVHPVLAYVARVRGLVCLHASVVSARGRIILLVGSTGAGKSTTAAALARAGNRILADDVAVIDREADGLCVRPGPALPRLDSAAARAIFGPEVRVSPIFANPGGSYAKTYAAPPRPQTSAGESGYPTVVYVLGDRTGASATATVTPMSPRAGLLSMVANTFADRVARRRHRSRVFEILSQIANDVPIRRLCMPSELALVRAGAKIVLDDLGTAMRANG